MRRSGMAPKDSTIVLVARLSGSLPRSPRGGPSARFRRMPPPGGRWPRRRARPRDESPHIPPIGIGGRVRIATVPGAGAGLPRPGEGRAPEAARGGSVPVSGAWSVDRHFVYMNMAGHLMASRTRTREPRRWRRCSPTTSAPARRSRPCSTTRILLHDRRHGPRGIERRHP